MIGCDGWTRRRARGAVVGIATVIDRCLDMTRYIALLAVVRPQSRQSAAPRFICERGYRNSGVTCVAGDVPIARTSADLARHPNFCELVVGGANSELFVVDCATVAESAGDRWRAHPLAARAVQLLIVSVPLAAGYGATVLCVRLLHRQLAESHWWLLVPAAVSIVACVAVERLTRMLLPLAALLKLSMLFPDRAPTRYKVARQAFNVRSLRDKLATAPASDASSAAEAALALITALTSHDRRTRGHCERVRVFTDLLGDQLRLPRESRDKLRWVSLLHDIGKLRVAAEILNKPAKLNPTEWDLVAAHPDNGAQLLGPLTDWLGEWAGAVRQHHEKFDGTGYPDGAAGDQISRAGRIVAIADSYEVMTAHRAYKKPMATAAARAELARCAGTQFDPTYVRAFLAIPLPKLLWAMGPGSLLMNLPLLRAAADTANKGVIATTQTGVAAVSAAAVMGTVTVTTGIPATIAVTAVSSPVSSTHQGSPTPAPTGRVVLAPTPTSTTPVPTQTPHDADADGHTWSDDTSHTHTHPDTDVDRHRTAPAAPVPPPVLTAPGAPTGVAASAGDQQAVVFWNAPASDGGSPITGYTVTAIGPGGPLAPVTVAASAVNTIVTGLTNGASYTFTVDREQQCRDVGGGGEYGGDTGRSAERTHLGYRERRRSAGDGVVERPGQRRRFPDHLLHGDPDRTWGCVDVDRGRRRHHYCGGTRVDQRHRLHVQRDRRQRRRRISRSGQRLRDTCGRPRRSECCDGSWWGCAGHGVVDRVEQ